MPPPIFTDDYIRHHCPETRPIPMKVSHTFAVTEPTYLAKGLTGIKYVAPPVHMPPTMNVYARALSGHRSGIKREEAVQAITERVRSVVAESNDAVYAEPEIRDYDPDYDPDKDYTSADSDWENSFDGEEETKSSDPYKTPSESSESSVGDAAMTAPNSVVMDRTGDGGGGGSPSFLAAADPRTYGVSTRSSGNELFNQDFRSPDREKHKKKKKHSD